MCYKPVIIGYTDFGAPKKVSCRKCIECLQVRANEWGLRCHFELLEHQENCFLTLTYENNPVVLVKSELQNFIKRLRKKIAPRKIKYFSCGEYGDKKLRPHFHIIIFGYDFKDKEYVKMSGSDKPIYRSKELESIWTYGMCTVQEANVQTARYSAKYSMKQKKDLPEYLQDFPEFNTMSQNLGIDSIMKRIDVYLQTDEIYIDGFSYQIPKIVLEKYFNSKFNILGERLEAINKFKETREKRYQSYDQLKTRERIAEKKKLFAKVKVL